MASATRRPLRSSPLAGPALSHDDSRQLRSHLNSSSTPNLADLPKPDGGHLPPRSKSSQACNNLAPHWTPVLEDRHSHYSTSSTSTSSEVSKPGRKVFKLRKPHPSARTTAIPPPHRSDTFLPFPQQQRQQRSAPCTPTRRARSLHGPSQETSTPPLLTRCPEVLRSDESWMTFSPTAEIPRFSRLGIKASHVVMPLSAKEFHRRRQRQMSAAQPLSTLASSSISTSTSASTSRLQPPPPPSGPPTEARTSSRSFTTAIDDYEEAPPQSLLKGGASASDASISGDSGRERVPSLTRSSSDGSSDDSLDCRDVLQVSRTMSDSSGNADAGSVGGRAEVEGVRPVLQRPPRSPRRPIPRNLLSQDETMLPPPPPRSLPLPAIPTSEYSITLRQKIADRARHVLVYDDPPPPSLRLAAFGDGGGAMDDERSVWSQDEDGEEGYGTAVPTVKSVKVSQWGEVVKGLCLERSVNLKESNVEKRSKSLRRMLRTLSGKFKGSR
ncbi:hypothetical protein CC1G_11860 [Coprinopsis cinerea okayama7|uniref:Uncharacterized protein n=1 Tax=Coprinopsis cinerea (strain Okayama-7 / 130 / ATCC MYA-4618 / FGSC 9003) TaxID=240176 RepID=A8PH34_COPC7|nr:hypothetical protein CC1G_11860 [Coprinopsis cinerea okayama7\|eukprot:XP_001841332.1 hypothetical protein CC1G_11860 [Coprinopsis cinerea okayama7\